MEEGFIAKRIYELRSKHNISGRKLSLELGLSNSYITQIENSQRMPSIENLFKICTYFGISLAEFFSDDSGLVVLSEEQRKLLEAAKGLSPCQVSAVKAVMKAMKSDK